MIKLEQDEYYPVNPNIIESLERYLNYGIMPGSFVTAVLENNLCEAFGRADMFNAANLKNIVGYVYNNIPSSSWGSPQKVQEWQSKFREASKQNEGE